MARWTIATRAVALLLLAAPPAANAFLTEPPRPARPPANDPGRDETGAPPGRERTPPATPIAAAASAPPANAVDGSANAGPSSVDEVAVPPPYATNPVLLRVYPALVAQTARYGNPNIPLGNPDGRRCHALRRLHFQGKLSDDEASLLERMGFRFHSFEDVYFECDFDEMLGKLMEYREEFGTFQIPKKYAPDPELGAWVCMLRRLRRTDDLPPERIDVMDGVGFEWVSTRKCGGSFMTKYREALEFLSGAVEEAGAGGDDDAGAVLLEGNAPVRKWIEAQRLAHENGKLSQQRTDYMDDLPGIDWRRPDLTPARS